MGLLDFLHLKTGVAYLGDRDLLVGGELVEKEQVVGFEKIVAVGTFAVGRAGRTIDCAGLVVAPGFIDLHSHSDGPIVRPATRGNANYLTQGCTTVVTGNCGSGPG